MQIISYSELAQDPHCFQKLTGMSVKTFDQLYQKFAAIWQKTERERLRHLYRQRAVGGGRKYALASQDQLLTILLWTHLRLSPAAVATLFGVHSSTMIRNRQRIVAALQNVDKQIISMDSFPAAGEARRIEDHITLLNWIATGKGQSRFKSEEDNSYAS